MDPATPRRQRGARGSCFPAPRELPVGRVAKKRNALLVSGLGGKGAADVGAAEALGLCPPVGSGGNHMNLCQAVVVVGVEHLRSSRTNGCRDWGGARAKARKQPELDFFEPQGPRVGSAVPVVEVVSSTEASARARRRLAPRDSAYREVVRQWSQKSSRKRGGRVGDWLERRRFDSNNWKPAGLFH